MKRCLCLLLLTALCLGLAGCDSDLPQNTFFSQELLTQHCLSGMPVPPLEQSCLSEKVFYGNLRHEEYEDYVNQVLYWLRCRKDIHYLGSWYSRRLYGEIVPYDVYTFLPEDYDAAAVRHDFVFSPSPELREGNLATPVRLSIVRETGSLGLTNFTYNTKITISIDGLPAEFDHCAQSHTYDTGTAYPVPGMDREITVSCCIYCGDVTQDAYFDDGTWYEVELMAMEKQIRRTNRSEGWRITQLYPGQLLEITTWQESVLTVNGEQIPLLRQETGGWVYGFIMPPWAITIEIVPIAG